LTTLFLNGNAFSGSIEPVFQGLTAISFLNLDLSSNQLTGCIPGLTTGLGNFSGYVGLSLNVSHNHIGGYFNVSNQFSFQLIILDLSYNNISGDISTHRFCVEDNGLCSLQILLINNNHFSGKLPDFSTFLWPITNLDVSNNQFNGIIPPSIWNISTNLTVLNLSGNNFSGNLPPVTNPQSLLETLDLSNNQISGIIPPSIWNISTNLIVLNLSGNNFSGNLPPVTNPQSLLETL
jgi:hypothetical protein